MHINQPGQKLVSSHRVAYTARPNLGNMLLQAEAVAALVNARTAAAADSALAGLSGGLGAAIAAMRTDTLELLAELEARIDFDEDLPELNMGRLEQRIRELQGRIAGALNTSQRGQLLSKGLQASPICTPHFLMRAQTLKIWHRRLGVSTGRSEGEGMCGCMTGGLGRQAERWQEQPAQCLEWERESHCDRHSRNHQGCC